MHYIKPAIFANYKYCKSTLNYLGGILCVVELYVWISLTMHIHDSNNMENCAIYVYNFFYSVQSSHQYNAIVGVYIQSYDIKHKNYNIVYMNSCNLHKPLPWRHSQRQAIYIYRLSGPPIYPLQGWFMQVEMQWPMALQFSRRNSTTSSLPSFRNWPHVHFIQYTLFICQIYYNYYI